MGGAAIADAETPRAVSFRPVTVIAEGHGQAGVTGVDEGAWVVTVGQQLLGGEPRVDPSAPAAVEVRSGEQERDKSGLMRSQESPRSGLRMTKFPPW